MSIQKGYLGKVETTDGTIAEMMNWSISGMENEMLESTSFEDAFKSFEVGRGDGGTISISGNYSPGTTAVDALIVDWRNKAAVVDLKLYYSGSAFFRPSASGTDTPAITAVIEIISIEIGTDQSGLATIDISLKVSAGYMIADSD